jgi:hypothetical protein
MKIFGNGEATPPAKQPPNGGAYAVKMVRNYSKLPKELQKAARSAFSKFSAEAVRDLQGSGHFVQFSTPHHGGAAGGMINSRNNMIEMFVEPGDPHTESYLIHEMVHAVDRQRFRKENGVLSRAMAGEADCFISRQDPKLKDLHLNYAKRSLPAVGRKMAEFARENPELKERRISAAAREYEWKLNDDQLELKEHNKALNTIESLSPYLIKGGLMTTIGAAALTVAAGAGALAVGGLIAAPLLTVGVKRLAAGWQAYKDDKALQGFKNEAVQVDSGGRISFDLGKTASDEIEPTTVYATLNRKSEEYLAESMTEYLRSPESRDSLKERDPEMHSYCEGWKLAPGTTGP